jgi:beta-lactamase superfamily II metal-dependent hydrolase
MAHSDISFLNVGAGSCTVVESPSGRVSMIDINDGTELREARSMSSEARALREAEIKELSARLVDPITWVKTRVGCDGLFRFVLSHPDCDHLAGLRRILLRRELPTLNFWDIPHSKALSKADFTNDDLWSDWAGYEVMRRELDVEGLVLPTLVRPLRGARGHYWIDDDIEVLSPTSELVEGCDALATPKYNNASYVLRTNFGGTSVLIPGDVESKGWNDILEAGIDLAADILVASHHGRMSGFSERAMDAIRPAVVIISTSALDPAVDAEDEYRKWTDHVYSTRAYGTIIARMYDDGTFDLFVDDGALVERFIRTQAA